MSNLVDDESAGFNALFGEEVVTITKPPTVGDVLSADENFQKKIIAHCEAQMADLVAIQAQLEARKAAFIELKAKFEANYTVNLMSLSEEDLANAIVYRDRLQGEITVLEEKEKYVGVQLPKYKGIVDSLDVKKPETLTKAAEVVSQLNHAVVEKLDAHNKRKAPELDLKKMSVDVVKEKSKSFLDRAKQFLSEKAAYVRENKLKVAAGVCCAVLGVAACVAGFFAIPGAKTVAGKLFEKAESCFTGNSGKLIAAVESKVKSVAENQAAVGKLVDTANAGVEKVGGVPMTPIITRVAERAGHFKESNPEEEHKKSLSP